MDAKITQIEVLLDKLNLLFAQVKEDGKLDRLEQELMMKYTRQLSELLHTDIPVTVPPVQRTEKPVETVIPPVMEVIPEIVEPVMEEPQPDPEPEPEVLLPDELNPVPQAEVEAPAPEEIRKVEPPVLGTREIIEEVRPEPKPEPPVTATKKPLVTHDDTDDEEEGAHGGLHKKLSGHGSKKTLADKIIAHKSKDLKSVIDLNARISLTRLLFDNDKHAFDSAIKTLNETASYAEAEHYILEDLRRKMGWKDFKAINQLLDLVKLKFS